MKSKAPSCPLCNEKTSRVYSLVLRLGKKKWIPVGWICPNPKHYWPVMDGHAFEAMGHGSPIFPVCEKCNNHMKALYQQDYGKNQMRRIPNMFSCFDPPHEVITVPEPPFIHDVSWELHGWDFKAKDEEIIRDLMHKSYDAFKEEYGEEYARSWIRIEESRTRIEKVFNFAKHNNLASGHDHSLPHRVKMVFSNGMIGDYSFGDYEYNEAKTLEKNLDYSQIGEYLNIIGIRIERERPLMPYINTIVVMDLVLRGITKWFRKPFNHHFRLSDEDYTAMLKLFLSPESFRMTLEELKVLLKDLLASPTNLDLFHHACAMKAIEEIKVDATVKDNQDQLNDV
jgi:hypothetical protein